MRPRWASGPTGFQTPAGASSPADMVGRRELPGLSGGVRPPIICAMFSVDEATAAVDRQVYEASGELSAVVEFRRHFPGITNNDTARLCVRTIASWKPLPPLSQKRTRTCRTKSSTP
jgi:hypothetical protein